MATSRSIAMNPPMILPVMIAVMLLETERGVAISCDIAAESFSVLVASGDSDVVVVIIVVDDEDDVMLVSVVVTV